MSVKNVKYQLTKGLPTAGQLGRQVNFGQFLRGGNVLFNFLTLFIISYFVPNSSGLLGIIVSFAVWTLLYDFLLSNRLKKALIVLLATRRIKTGKAYVINTYAVIGLLVGITFILFLVITRYVNWHDFFPNGEMSNSNFNKIVVLVFTLFSFRILFMLAGSLIASTRLTENYENINFISALLTLGVALILSLDVSGYITYLRLTIYSAPLILFFFSFSILLRGKLTTMQPSQKKLF